MDTSALKEHVDLLELVGRDTRLRKVASTRGGEWAGPYPFCGGRDRFRVQPEHGRWWCRQCGGERWSDAIDYIRRRDGVSFLEACHLLGARLSETAERRGRLGAAECVAGQLGLQRASALAEDAEPTDIWRVAATRFVETCERHLWSDAGADTRAYLRGRGLSDPTLRAWRVGFQPTFGLREPAREWGLDGDTVSLPRGCASRASNFSQACRSTARTSLFTTRAAPASAPGCTPAWPWASPHLPKSETDGPPKVFERQVPP